jgi:hypothetical protein
MNKRELLGLFLIIAVVAGFSGCAGTQVQNKESMLSSAGFRTLTPSTQKQWAMYSRMTPYQLERNTLDGSLAKFANPVRETLLIESDFRSQLFRQR